MSQNSPTVLEEKSPAAPVETADTLPASPLEAPEEPALVRNKYADKMNRPKRRLPKPVKIGITVVVLAAVIGGAIYLVKQSQDKAKEADTTQQTAMAMRGMLETYVEGSGRTAAKNKVDLGKEIKGEVTEVLVQSGDTVKKGDVLFIIDPKDTRKELDTARAELADVMRTVDEAANTLSTAQKNVGYLAVTAPFSGKMIPNVDDKGASPSYKAGQNLSSGTVLGTMVDDSAMRLPLYFNYTYIDKIKTGASASVSIPASMSTVNGTVSEIERVQKISDDGAVLFRVILKVPNPGTLKKDMIATASISTADGPLMPAEEGKLEYAREEEVTAKVSGEISTIGNIDYYRYSAGQTICQLKSDETTNAVGTAQRSLESAQKNLADKQTRIAELEKLMADSTVTSPIDGVVTNMTATVGEKLEGTVAPCTVADLTSIVVNVDISELDVDKVAIGMPVTISLDYDESQMFMGTVSSVSLQASTNQNNGGGGGGGGSTVTFPAVIQLDSAEGLLPDRGVSYKIISASREDCVTVPSSAVVFTENGAALYAKPAEGQTFDNAMPSPEGSTVPEGFVLVPVETGISDDTNTEIISGIDEGTEIFLAGPQDAYAQFDNMSGAVMVG